MATVLRPPIAFRPQAARPIASADAILNPVVLKPVPKVVQLSDSAPVTEKFIGFPEQLGRPLTLGIPLPVFQRASDSSPVGLKRPQVDVIPNLLGTTLASAPAVLGLPLNAGRLSDSAPILERILPVDQPPRAIQFDPIPKFLGLSESAPQRRAPNVPDVYLNLQGTTLVIAASLALPLNAGRLSESAPQVERVLPVDQPPRPVWADPIPQFARRLDWPTPPPLRIGAPDVFPNLGANVLAPIVINLPLAALRMDWAAPQAKEPPGTVDEPVIRSIVLNPAPPVLQQSGPPAFVFYWAWSRWRYKA